MSAPGVNLPVEVRARGRTSPGVVYDLSCEGCLLGCGHGLITAGTAVSLRFASGTRLNGRAVLLHGLVARIEFELPLHEAVFAHLTDGQSGRRDKRQFHGGAASEGRRAL